MRPHRPLAAVQRITAATGALVIGAIALGPANVAHAATVVSRETHKGFILEGRSSSYDGCLDSSTWLWASETSVSYYSYANNYCTGTRNLSHGDAVPTTFEVKNNLSSGHVVATIQLQGQGSGQELVVDNTWTATGPVTSTSNKTVDEVPGSYRIVQKFKGSTAPAQITGTVPVTQGTISKNATRTITITHE